MNLKFNFNKPKPAAKPPPQNTSKAAFGDSDDEDAPPKPAKAKTLPSAVAGLNEDLRSYTSLSQETSDRLARQALEEDPTGICVHGCS